MKEKPEIPQHTKWGIRISAIVILLITIMIIKNCMGSFMYGISTEQELQKQYYELGYSHGLQKAKGSDISSVPETKNLLLRKLYRKGYREGWDSAQSNEKAMDTAAPLKKDQ